MYISMWNENEKSYAPAQRQKAVYVYLWSKEILSFALPGRMHNMIQMWCNFCELFANHTTIYDLRTERIQHFRSRIKHGRRPIT